MTLTKIDCNFFRGETASLDGSSYVGLNPGPDPGSVVIAGVSAVRDGIGSQVASKLALDNFLDGTLQFFQDGKVFVPFDGEEVPSEPGLQILETAFRAANTGVYEFGSKLSAGGRMAATLIGLVVEGGVISCARAGKASAYLLRSGTLFPFFETNVHSTEDPALGRFVGAQALVSVELASVPADAGDVVILISRELDSEAEAKLTACAAGIDFSQMDASEAISRQVFTDVSNLEFVASIRIGPDALFLHY